MRVTTALLVWLITASAALADWSTNVWPSYLYPLQGVTQFREAHSGGVERCTAVGVEPPDVLTNLYLSHWSNLTNIKAKLKLCIPYFVNTNPAIAGSYDSWFTTNPITTTNFYNLGEWVHQWRRLWGTDPQYG